MPEPVESATTAGAAKGSYRSILKSTSLIGGASSINILIGMVRTKFVAILLGTSGVGLMGMYVQILGLANVLFGMGLKTSGVRQVAEAVGTGDDERIARTVITVRRLVWISGALGMVAMAVFSGIISKVSFSTADYGLPIALLGFTILLTSITTGQTCLLQGTRRIADLAKISVIGAFNATAISIPCYYLWGVDGIVVALILSAVAMLITSWWYARRVEIKKIHLPWRAGWSETKELLGLGVSFMGAGLVGTLMNYLIRVLLLRQLDLGSVGIYQAAFSLSGILVGFVLSAMGVDYYPRLTAVADDNPSVVRMVNEQTEISLLLAVPALTGMMIFAPLIIRIFYSASFGDAIPVLRWCIFGVLGRACSWPLGFVLLAKGRGGVYFFTELAGAAFHVSAVYFFVSFWGINGAGIAFMGVYIFYTLLMLAIMYKLTGTIWSPSILIQVFLAAAVLIILFVNCIINSSPIFLWGSNLGILGLVSLLCLRQLSRKSGMGWKELYAKLRPPQ